ncbi:MAG: sodium:solute symporter family protein [Sedimentisphaerales bacterium]|nr:sodium:solute symporter family protein [Sedimentisphaerales bacterium]
MDILGAVSFLGFHWIDILLILGYLAVITYVGKRSVAKVKNQEDFFLAGRGVGKIFQFFLNMSTITDSGQAVNTAAAAFSKGLGGVWLLLAPILSGPYYWFMAGWFRRARLVTMAELFEERFKSKFIACIYACVGIWLSIINIGIANKISLRTFQAMTMKGPEARSVEEQAKIDMYKEYRNLDELYKSKQLPVEKQERYETLSNMHKKNEIAAYVSYTKTWWFYAIYIGFMGAYVIMGGLQAAVVNTMIQGLLILAFSGMMIPIAVKTLGGWGGFADKMPDHMLYFFGSGLDEWSIWAVAAYMVANYIIGITGHQGNMANNGSAKDEITARTGNIGGAYTKRVLTMLWAMCGLLAYALFKDQISDPDTAWGVMSNNLLCVGLRGIMIAGILAANMSTVAGVSVYLSALFVRHLYKPFAQNKSERHYVNVSRISIAGILLLSVYIAVASGGILDILKMLPSLNVIFGAPVLLLLFWKRLTIKAVYVQVIACALIFGILPGVLPKFEAVRQAEWLTQQTAEKTVVRRAPATEIDVQLGRAEKVGQKIEKDMVIAPRSIYFDKVARSDPDNPNSPMAGIGRIKSEMVIAKTVGLNLQNMKPSTLLTLRYLIDTLLPFFILIPISMVTKNVGLDENIARFYVKMKTKVIADHDLDKAELQKSYADPTRFDHTKLFPHTSWEFCKWDWEDTWGFLLGIGLTTGILFTFWLVIQTLLWHS